MKYFSKNNNSFVSEIIVEMLQYLCNSKVVYLNTLNVNPLSLFLVGSTEHVARADVP